MPARIPPPESYPLIASPMIIAETDSHVTIAFEVPKASLRRHARFLDQLAALAQRNGD